MKYFDINNKRLLFFQKNYKNGFWDAYWLKNWDKLKNKIFIFNKNSLVNNITSRFLQPKDGPILEGGCGLGNYVYSLSCMGYDVIGIDYAKNIIKKVKNEVPSLNIEFGDVSHLRFPDSCFAGYWSLGVIEHYFNGYFGIINEMYRVITSKGYLFITFPYMSFLRNCIAKFNLYKIFNNEFYKEKKIPKSFYQYALNKDSVIKDFREIGFNLKFSLPLAGIKGLKDEIFFMKFFLRRFLQLLYDAKKPYILRLLKGLIDKALLKFSGHSILLVFQKL